MDAVRNSVKSSQVMASDMHRQSFCSTYNIIEICPTTKTPILLLAIYIYSAPTPCNINFVYVHLGKGKCCVIPASVVT